VHSYHLYIAGFSPQSKTGNIKLENTLLPQATNHIEAAAASVLLPFTFCLLPSPPGVV
jgi:hypothetical protein